MPLPKPAPIETARLRLRPVLDEDVAAFMNVMGDDAVTRYVPYGSWTSPADGHAWLERMRLIEADGSATVFTIAERESNLAIGTILYLRGDDASQRAEVGYTLASHHWGRGLMTEALRAWVGYGIEAHRLHRIEAQIDPRNAASARVLQRLGFAYEGTQRERYFTKGEWCDSALYALLAREWKTER
jgi:[ribosomal protein S5]-alanine N-acetyltransferase